MRRTTDNFSFKTLLANLPRGEPLSTGTLAKSGLRPKHASYLASHGWLVRLGRGAYMLPGDNLTRDGCLAFLSSNVPGLHVGGKTALAWRGVRQNLTFNERIGLWGEAPTRVPPWLTQRFSCSYQTTKIFDEALPVEFGVASLPGGRPDVLVSVSERALLELLSDVGKFQTLEETGNLAESARNLREPVMDELLAHVKRIKVARLARRLSEELELPWAALARTHSDRLGGADRWVAVSKTGVRLELKRK